MDRINHDRIKIPMTYNRFADGSKKITFHCNRIPDVSGILNIHIQRIYMGIRLDPDMDYFSTQSICKGLVFSLRVNDKHIVICP